MVQVLAKTASAGAVLLVLGTVGGAYAGYRICAEIGHKGWEVLRG